MGRHFFKNLLSNITTDIESDLPQIKTPPAPAPALVRLIPTERNSTRCTVFEFDNKAEDEDEEGEGEGEEERADLVRHNLPFHLLADFEIPHGQSKSIYRGQQTNGLLLLHSVLERDIYICNPFTRQYIKLCCSRKCKSDNYLMSYGFGVSEISAKYKVVCTNVDAGSGSFHVYTLGTGTWRRVEAASVSGYTFSYNAHIVCNGSLHWTVYDSTHTLWICGFDLETERVSIFSAPAVDRRVANVKLNVLRDCLCLSYTRGYKLVIWMMKDYRVGESWTIECKISVDFDIDFGYDFDCHDMTVHPIKLFKNGDVLMLFEDKCLFYYSHETRTTQQVGMLTDGNPEDADEDDISFAMIYTPSVFSLRKFEFENVTSF